MARRAMAFAVCCACAAPTAQPFQSYVTATSGSDGTTSYHFEPSGGGIAYALAFPTAGIQLPAQLSAAGMDLLAAPGTCEDFAGIGVGIHEVVQAVAPQVGGDPLTGPPPQVTITSGDAFVQAVVPWATTWIDAGSNTQTMTGQTAFTAFPSGRIVRSDTMVVGASDGIAGPGDCGCAMRENVGSLELAPFWSFVKGSADVDGSDRGAVDGSGAGCTLYDAGGSSLTVGVLFPGGGDGVKHGFSDFSTYQVDLGSNQQQIDESRFGPIPSAIEVTDEPTCAATIPLLAEVPLVLDGALIVPDAGGVYEVGSSSDRELDFSSGSSTVPPGFAMQLALGDHALIQLNGTPTEFAVQPAPDGRTFLYVAAGLAPGDVLSVTPE